MTQILPALKTLFAAATRPGTYFSGADRREMITPAVIGAALLLGVGLLLLFATALVHFQEISIARAGVSEYYAREGVIPLIDDPSPWRHLTFPIIWATLFALVAGLRYGALALFGDARDFLVLLAISIFGLAPMVVIAILHGIGNNLFPFAAPLEESNALLIRSYAMIALVLVGIAWEGHICVRAFRIVCAQNAGRAALTWLTPWFALVAFYATLRFFGG